MDRRTLLEEMAREAGFDLVGFAPLRPPRDAERFERWLADGRHGAMDWLERQRERIVDPRLIRPEARTLLALGYAHSRPAQRFAGGGRVARYALGRDYHNVLGSKLRALARRLVAEGLCTTPPRAIVDAGPLLERSHAAEAGLGFASKAANLLHPRFGPWFFLCELLVDVPYEELAQRAPVPPAGSCGTCTACIDACPTGAILEPGVVHAPACISYLTIELRGAPPRETRVATGEWLFGCDVCSEVCPWGDKAPDVAARFGDHAALREDGEASDGALLRFLRRDERVDLAGSPLGRAKREGLARNAAIVLGNLLAAADGGGAGASAPDDGLAAARRELLTALATDASPVVREAAGWGLARGAARAGTDERDAARDALERARSHESDEAAAAGLRHSLGELG